MKVFLAGATGVIGRRLVPMLGVLGVSLGRQEGFELNLLGLNFGIDFLNPALKLPFIGRLGASER